MAVEKYTLKMCIKNADNFKIFSLSRTAKTIITSRTTSFPVSLIQLEISYFIKYTGCNRRNGPDFGRVFLRSYYTDITQNTYIQSSMVMEILAREV